MKFQYVIKIAIFDYTGILCAQLIQRKNKKVMTILVLFVNKKCSKLRDTLLKIIQNRHYIRFSAIQKKK